MYKSQQFTTFPWGRAILSREFLDVETNRSVSTCLAYINECISPDQIGFGSNLGPVIVSQHASGKDPSSVQIL